jgi:hypothetical protein
VRTPAEVASVFFVDTGAKIKSTNWTRLRDEIAARDDEFRAALLPLAAVRASGGKRWCLYCSREADSDDEKAACPGRVARSLVRP